MSGSGFLTRSETNQSLQPQKMARSLKYQIKEAEGLYYICSENKGTDQLHIYHDQSSQNLLSGCWTAVRQSENFCWTEKKNAGQK